MVDTSGSNDFVKKDQEVDTGPDVAVFRCYGILKSFGQRVQDESIDEDKEWFEIWMLNIIIIIEMVKIIIYLDKEINIIIINS